MPRPYGSAAGPSQSKTLKGDDFLALEDDVAGEGVAEEGEAAVGEGARADSRQSAVGSIFL